MAIFTGAGVALVTPFRKDGSVNYDKLDELIDYHCENGTDSIIICGTTGESSTLSEEEHMECIKFAVERTKKRIPVIAGTGSNATYTTIDMSREAASYGADGLLLVTPYYNKATQEGLALHYKAVAKEAKAPIILYSVASRTGLNIAPVESPVSFTSNVQNWMWAIPTNSKNPGKAMEFLNLLYTDADLINLFSFGIEGEHYVLNEEGFATDGPNTAAYADKASWKAGNAYLSHIWEGDDADLYEQLQAFNESAAQSCAMGFVMDNSTVSSEYTALQSVLAKYEVMLEWGFAGDVDATIEEFNKSASV